MATQGPNSPGTMADDATVGTVAWTTPDNAKVSDNVYTTAIAAAPPAKTSHYLKATNFSFTIPAGATIDGIVAEIEKKDPGAGVGGGIKDSKVQIIKSDGSIGATNKADTVNNWTSTDTYKTYGASNDLWGETWTSTDINNANFGVVLSAVGMDNTSEADVDHIRITVYYTPLASGNNNLIALGVN